jgi:HAD superfamily hydrolase (TIGR01490 family)
MQNGIAFFDFDGTITTKDTLLELIKYSHGVPAFCAGFGLMTPWLAAMKAGVITNSDAKQRVLRYFYGGWTVDRWKTMCAAFVSEKVPALVRPKALEEIRRYREMGIPVVVVSASPEDMVGLWARGQGLEIIGTRLEVRDGVMTGRIEGANCYGAEKERRIRDLYRVEELGTVYAYGDSKGDREMLGLAKTAFYKPFR